MKTKEISKNGGNNSLVEHRGSLYRLLAMKDNWCLYEVNGGSRYEIFKIRQKRPLVTPGKVYPARVVFPTASEMGSTAWSFRSYPTALQKFEVLTTAPGAYL